MKARDQGIAVDEAEARNHSFIVRVWVEEAGAGGGARTWRGHVTHAATRERRDIRELGDIGLFIMPHLEQAGVRPPWCWRAFRWLKRPPWKSTAGAF